jgi:hypothetical protein
MGLAIQNQWARGKAVLVSPAAALVGYPRCAAMAEPEANFAQLAPDSISGIFAGTDMRQRAVLFSIRRWIEDRAELAISVNGRGHDDLV